MARRYAANPGPSPYYFYSNRDRDPTDLFGCHGTSGSGVLQVDADGNYELLGPAVGGNDGNDGWQATRLCTDPDSPAFSPGMYNLSYTSNKDTRQLAEAFQTVLDADRGI